MNDTTPMLIGGRQRQTLIQFFWVPSRFWDDHRERCPSDNGEAGMCQEQKRSGKRVLVYGNAQQIETLRSDAAFYGDPKCMDYSECPGIVMSARATLRALTA